VATRGRVRRVGKTALRSIRLRIMGREMSWKRVEEGVLNILGC
jgi:hypothetical protein